MQSVCLMLVRFCPAAWVGAAHLFVAVALRIVRSPEIDSSMRMVLTQIRFPVYYRLEFGLLTVGFVAGILARRHPTLNRRSFRIALGILAVVLLLAVGDYLWIYSPLAEMMRQQLQAASFRPYHKASMIVNGINVYLTLIASILTCWPNRSRAPSTVAAKP